MTWRIPPSDGWFGNPYRMVDLSTPDIRIFEEVPAALIRVRATGMPSASEGCEMKAHGVLDTGASRTLVPLWVLYKLGVAVDERSKFKVLSATGWTVVYRAEIELAIFHGGAWIDLGSTEVVSPDTEVSRDPEQGLPILLGRSSFFGKFQLLLDEPGKEAWLRRIA